MTKRIRIEADNDQVVDDPDEAERLVQAV